MSNVIRVSNLPPHLTEAQVRELLTAFGALKFFSLPRPAGVAAAQNSGYALVEYEVAGVTDVAVGALDGLEVCARSLVAKREDVAPPKPPTASALSVPPPGAAAAETTTLFTVELRGLATAELLSDPTEYEITLSDIEQECGELGDVSRVTLERAAASGETYGHALVSFADVADARRCIKALHGRKYNGRVVEAVAQWDEATEAVAAIPQAGEAGMLVMRPAATPAPIGDAAPLEAAPPPPRMAGFVSAGTIDPSAPAGQSAAVPSSSASQPPEPSAPAPTLAAPLGPTPPPGPPPTPAQQLQALQSQLQAQAQAQLQQLQQQQAQQLQAEQRRGQTAVQQVALQQMHFQQIAQLQQQQQAQAQHAIAQHMQHRKEAEAAAAAAQAEAAAAEAAAAARKRAEEEEARMAAVVAAGAQKKAADEAAEQARLEALRREAQRAREREEEQFQQRMASQMSAFGEGEGEQLTEEEREQQLIEERRRRRAAIAAKHKAGATAGDEPVAKAARVDGAGEG